MLLLVLVFVIANASFSRNAFDYEHEHEQEHDDSLLLETSYRGHGSSRAHHLGFPLKISGTRLRSKKMITSHEPSLL